MRRLHGAPLLVALVLGLGLMPAAVRADTAPPTSPPPPEPPRSLVVALPLANPRLQAGVVRGREVILARGFEVELARVLARRLGARVDGFVYVPSAARQLASSQSGWHIALGGLEAVAGPRAAGDATRPYLTTDVAVVARRGLDPPRRIADLRASLVCAVRGTAAAEVVSSRVRPRRPSLIVAGVERLQAVLRTGACDVALVAVADVGRFVDGHRRPLGSVVGRIADGHGFAIVVRRGTGLDVAAVDRELARLARDRTLGRIAKTWLGLDPAMLRVLR